MYSSYLRNFLFLNLSTNILKSSFKLYKFKSSHINKVLPDLQIFSYINMVKNIEPCFLKILSTWQKALSEVINECPFQGSKVLFLY